jgi:hypothetical protein
MSLVIGVVAGVGWTRATLKVAAACVVAGDLTLGIGNKRSE